MRYNYTHISDPVSPAGGGCVGPLRAGGGGGAELAVAAVVGRVLRRRGPLRRVGVPRAVPHRRGTLPEGVPEHAGRRQGPAAPGPGDGRRRVQGRGRGRGRLGGLHLRQRHLARHRRLLLHAGPVPARRPHPPALHLRLDGKRARALFPPRTRFTRLSLSRSLLLCHLGSLGCWCFLLFSLLCLFSVCFPRRFSFPLFFFLFRMRFISDFFFGFYSSKQSLFIWYQLLISLLSLFHVSFTLILPLYSLFISILTNLFIFLSFSRFLLLLHLLFISILK